MRRVSSYERGFATAGLTLSEDRGSYSDDVGAFSYSHLKILRHTHAQENSTVVKCCAEGSLFYAPSKRV